MIFVVSQRQLSLEALRMDVTVPVWRQLCFPQISVGVMLIIRLQTCTLTHKHTHISIYKYIYKPVATPEEWSLPGKSYWISLLQCSPPPLPKDPPHQRKSPWGLWMCLYVYVCVSVCFSVHATGFSEEDGLSDAWVGGWFPQLQCSLQSNFPLMLSALLDIS